MSRSVHAGQVRPVARNSTSTTGCIAARPSPRCPSSVYATSQCDHDTEKEWGRALRRKYAQTGTR